jgi:ankyrin repeat protein
MVRIALGNGADINVKDVDGNTALILAVDSGCKELITYICEIGKEDGLDFDAVNNYGKSALHKAVGNLNFKAVKDIILSADILKLKIYMVRVQYLKL